jgi:rod shape determining protein RodA
MRLGELFVRLDWLLLGAVLLLVILGLAALFSSADTAQILSSRFFRQLIAAGLGLLVIVIVARIPYHILPTYSALLYSIGLVGLLSVYFTAQVIRGAASRLEIGGFQIQPSEFMKVALVIMLAVVLARRTRFTWRMLGTVALIVILPVGLVLLEPDVGVAALLLSFWVGLIFFAGLPWRAVSALAVLGAVAGGAAWQWFFADYQKARLLVFLDPTRDPLGAGYNVVQSIIALGSGQLWGRGLGHGPQSQLQFLPERHTDFILASLGEELGFVGLLIIFILYSIVLWRIARIARTTRDPLGQLLCSGVFLLLFISLAVSGGMNMGLLPVTGIPLPLLSYGGSNLLSTFVLIGIVQSVHVYSKWVQAPPKEISALV